MKKNFYISLICLLAVTSFGFVSCDDNDADTTKPVIRLIEPEEGQKLLIGGTHGVHFEMDLSDDVMLKSYKISIHGNFDHHTHSRATEETIEFKFDREYDASGKKEMHVHHHDIVILANAKPGDYHLMVYCWDAAGNEAYITRNIVLSADAEDDDDAH